MQVLMCGPKLMDVAVGMLLRRRRSNGDRFRLNDGDQLGRRLFQLNAHALRRTGQEVVPPEDWKWSPCLVSEVIPFAQKVRAYKALRCLLYQLESVQPEGLKQELRDTACWLADDIVTDLPEWHDTMWGA